MAFSSDPQWQALHGLVDQVAERQRADFGHISSDLKPDGSLVTDCDRWSDATIAAGLQRIYPDDGLLSEEGSTAVPSQRSCWVVDPLDGTTNFSVGLPIWAISLARFEDGQPIEALIDVPPLRQRYVAVRGQGVWRDGERLAPPGGPRHGCSCASLCTRSLPVIQQLPQRFPAKPRMLGVASLNLLGVGLGTMLAALEATPKIWDLAGVWLMLEELGCVIRPLATPPFPLVPGAPLAEASYPLLAACDAASYQRFLPWGEALLS
ncbi:MAG: inositol monophosphatase family protein [Synechococcus sp.]|nr:inositol monophosphatase family protein [Synechococcus sp.]